MSKNILTEDTIIEIGKSIPLSKFRAFFEATVDEELPSDEFQPWLVMQAGKTLKEALSEYGVAYKRKSMGEIMLERRFDIISEYNKMFINAFDEKIAEFGYDFGGGIGDGHVWGKYMIIYTKTGAKSKTIIARFYIRNTGIVLRLFFNNIDKHRAYIENSPEHIRSVFIGDYGDCSCEPKKENCRMRKTYTINEKQIEKCGGVVFEFWNPTTDTLSDYMDLLAEFYPVKKSKVV